METNNSRPIEEVIEEHILEDKLVVLEEADRKYSHGYKIHINTITIINAVTAELRRRGWLEPEEVSRLRDEHDKLAKNFSANAKLLDEALAKIAILTAVGVVTKSARENTPDEEVDKRHRIEAMRRVLERRVGKTEPTAQPTPEPPTEEEIGAAICNAEPSSIKVEMLPHEVTWREVAEAVQAADKNLAYYPLAIKYAELTKGGWVIKVIEGGEQHSYVTIDEALERLRDMAKTETKPEPFTPDTIWENEVYGFGYEELPTWVRDAILAEAGRRNAKGGE